MNDDVVGRLAAIEEIKQLKARYCRCVDTKQWSALRALFSEEASFEDTVANVRIESADAFVDAARSAYQRAVTMHHCHNPEIQITAPGEARGTWALHDSATWVQGEHEPREGFGHYYERYEKVDGVWRIAEIRLTYLHNKRGSDVHSGQAGQ